MMVVRLDAPVHRSIVVVDVVGSGRWRDVEQSRAREALDGMVRSAFLAAGVVRKRAEFVDRGDGMIVLVSPLVSKVDVLDPVLPLLFRALDAYNATVGPGLRMRLRIAVHAGEVLRLRSGWAGADVVLPCRLVDSEPLRAVSRTGVDVALVVSDTIHRAVVRHGYRGIDPDDFEPVRVAVKEVDVRAWLRTPRPAARLRAVGP